MSEIDTGVDFNFSFAPGITDPQILGFEIAGEIWSQHLGDTYQGDYLEINIHVDTTDELLPENVVGGAFPAIETGIQYSDIYDAIQNDATTAIDNVVKDSLLDTNKIDILVGGDVIDQNFKTHITRANLKALGIVSGDSTQLDGYIFVNNLYDSLKIKKIIIMSDLGGVDFDFSFTAGVSLEQAIAFEIAGEFWSQHLADNTTINILVEMTDYLPENVIGGALPGIEDNVRYEDFRYQLEQDITSDIDSLINYNQQDETDKFTGYFSSQYEEDGYKVDNNEYMKMTRANAKALNIIDPHDNGLDGYILMRDLDGEDDGILNNLRWHYDYSDNPIANDSLDFLSVAIHEIGHVLGFISGLDQADWLAGKRDVNEGNEDDYYSDLVGNLNNATPVDMLRFSQASYEQSGDGENWIDMSLGGNAYLSFTGSGGTPIAYFATGESQDLGGDGYQASHWKRQDNALGIMDPVLATGQRREITELDIQLFDGIGWNIRTENADLETDLETIYIEAKEVLANKIDATVEWMDTHPVTAAEILAPDFVDENHNNKDDRGEQLKKMIIKSGDVYKWGWQGGFWWGWQGGFWQSTRDFNQDGFWQNLTWQAVEISTNTPESTIESLEPDTYVLFDNSISVNNQRNDNLFNYLFNYESKKDLLVGEENESFLSKPKKQNKKDNDVNLSNLDWLINRGEDLQADFSRDLFSLTRSLNFGIPQA